MVTFPERARAYVAPGPARAAGGQRSATNMAPAERWLSGLGGSLLALYGLRRRDLPGVAIAAVRAALVDRALSGYSTLYAGLGVTTTGYPWLVQQHGPAAVLDAQRARRIERAVTIDADAATLYRRWRHLRTLPTIMPHLISVTETTATQSRWVARGPGGVPIEWEAELVNDIPGQLIAWKSVRLATVPNAGSVHFRPASDGRGTEVRVVLEYALPAGVLGVALARLLGTEPALHLRDDLGRFKRAMERERKGEGEGVTPFADDRRA